MAAALAYDPARQRVVAAHSNQTWEWDGGAWTQVADWGGGDRPRLAYDTARARTVSVAWGGQTLTTWEWDGTTWTQVADSGPPTREVYDVAYDRERQLLGLVRSVADTCAPAYGEISFDNTGLLDFATSYEHNLGLFPWNAVRRANRSPRGYSWLTILAEPVGDRLGGEAALRETAVFAEVSRLAGGGYWLLATTRLVNYDLAAAERVRQALAPVLPNRSARPDEPGELPHLLSTARTGRGPTRRAIPDEIFKSRIDVRDRSHHKVAVAVSAAALHAKYPSALIGLTEDPDGPHLVCWGAEPGEVWIWQFLPEDDPYAGFEIPRAPGRGWSIARDDTAIDHLAARQLTILDAVPGLQLYYGEDHATSPAMAMWDVTVRVNELYRAVDKARDNRR